jgi:NADH dehydrogenase
LSLPGHSEAFVTGDAAAANWNHNLIVPSLAPAAKQAGRDVADVFRAVALATIGRHAAIADLGGIKINGGTCVVALGLARIYFLIGVRAPMLVVAQWF